METTLVSRGLSSLACLIMIAVVMLFTTESHSQVNEKKVYRSATGVYKGKRFGGTAVFTNAAGAVTFVGKPDTIFAKVRIPIGLGKASSTINDSDLAGGSAELTGKSKKAKVKRGGKKVALKAVNGSGELGDGSPPFFGGKLSGTTVDKGSKWKAKGKAGAKRNEGGGITKTVSGVRGTGVN